MVLLFGQARGAGPVVPGRRQTEGPSTSRTRAAAARRPADGRSSCSAADQQRGAGAGATSRRATQSSAALSRNGAERSHQQTCGVDHLRRQARRVDEQRVPQDTTSSATYLRQIMSSTNSAVDLRQDLQFPDAREAPRRPPSARPARHHIAPGRRPAMERRRHALSRRRSVRRRRSFANRKMRPLQVVGRRQQSVQG